MSLTQAQIQTLKANIAANTNVIPAGMPWSFTYAGVAVQNVINGNNQDQGTCVAGWYNQLATGPFFVFNTAVPLITIANNILWKNYTPIPNPDGTALYTNVVKACQCDQISIQNLFLALAGSAFDASRVNLLQGLKDCTSAVPSGTPVGTNQDAGWTTNLKAAPGPLTRSATILEVLFAVASTGPLTGVGALGSSGNVAVPVVQGAVSFQDVLLAANS